MSFASYQTLIPWIAAADRPMPGVQPLGALPWLISGPDRAEQLAEKARLMAEQRGDVAAMTDRGRLPFEELKRHVVSALERKAETLHEDPLTALSQVAQEDFCVLVKHGDQHVLAGALLCFPASWRLAEKIGKPLDAIHGPVPNYGPVAARVQRLFDGVQVGKPLWRANALWYHDAALFQPRSVSAPRHQPDGKARYLRSERQVILRLPETKAVVFSIRTMVVEVPV